MKKILIVTACFILMLFAYNVKSAPVSNVSSEQFNAAKVAYVDMQEVLKNSKQYAVIEKERKEQIEILAKFVDGAKKEILKQSTEEKQKELEKMYNE